MLFNVLVFFQQQLQRRQASAFSPGHRRKRFPSRRLLLNSAPRGASAAMAAVWRSQVRLLKPSGSGVFLRSWCRALILVATSSATGTMISRSAQVEFEAKSISMGDDAAVSLSIKLQEQPPHASVQDAPSHSSVPDSTVPALTSCRTSSRTVATGGL
jgi:hypothetical protein